MSMFRIGGVYRQRNGDVVRLEDGGYGRKDQFLAVILNYKGIGTECKAGHRNSFTGADYFPDIALIGDRTLLPGKLHQVNGEWVPMSGPSPQEQAEIDSFRTQPAHVTFTEPERAPLDWNVSKPFDPFGPEFIVHHTECATPEAETHATQRLGDLGNPLHGSASLLKAS